MSKKRTQRKLETCECGKQKHSTITEAKNQRYFLGEQGRKLGPATYYKCQYGSWHWSSSAYDSDGRHIASIQEVLDQYVAGKNAREQMSQ